MNEKLATELAYRLVSTRVSIPTWVVLYINILISIMVANSVFIQDTVLFDHLAPFDGRLWSVMLLFSSVVTLHGLLAKYTATVAWGSVFGFMSWIMAIISWIIIDRGQSTYGIPLLSIPMIAFFMFVHLKHSYIEKLKKEVHG